MSARESSLQSFDNNEHSKKQQKFPSSNIDDSQQNVEKKRQREFIWSDPLRIWYTLREVSARIFH